MFLKNIYRIALLSFVFCVNSSEQEMSGVRYESLSDVEQELEATNAEEKKEIDSLSKYIDHNKLLANKKLFDLSKTIWINKLVAYKIPNDLAKKLQIYIKVFDKNQGAIITKKVRNIINNYAEFFNCYLKDFGDSFKIMGFVKSVAGILVKTSHRSEKRVDDEYGNEISNKVTYVESYALVTTSHVNSFQNLSKDEESVIRGLNAFCVSPYFYVSYKQLADTVGKTYLEISNIMRYFETNKLDDFELLNQIFTLRDLGDESGKCCCIVS